MQYTQKPSTPKRLARLGALVAILTLVMVLGAVQTVSASGPIVRGIMVEGNEVITNQAILSVVTNTIVGEPFDARMVERDLQAILDMGTFSWVGVDPVSALGGVRLVFKVVENPVVERVRLEVDTDRVSGDELLPFFPVKAGEILNVHKLDEESIYNFTEQVMAAKKVHLQPADLYMDDNNVLVLTLKATRIQEVQIRGNEKTLDGVILREIQIKPGDLYNVDDFQRNLSRLYNTGYFDEIGINVEPGKDPFHAVVIFDVVERKSRGFNGGLGWYSNEGLVGYAQLEDANFMGRGGRYSITAEVGMNNRRVFEITYFEPYITESGVSLGFEFHDRKQGPIEGETEFERLSRGGSLTFGRSLADYLRGSLRLKATNTTLEDTWKTRSIAGTLSYDNANHYLFPTEGGRYRLTQEVAFPHFFGGNVGFSRTELDLVRYLPLPRFNHSLAFHLGLGRVAPAYGESSVPSHELFRLGGSETIRGYGHGAFTGTHSAVFNTEYRFQVAKELQAVLFYDIGQAWNPAKGESLSWEDLGRGFGAGVRVNIPVLGPIRFDYGFGPNGGRAYFGMGSTF